jgi:hypothetical protein
MPPPVLLSRDPPRLPLFRSSDDPIPRSLELDPLRLSDELRSENIARSLLVPRSSEEDSRLRTPSLPIDEPLPLEVRELPLLEPPLPRMSLLEPAPPRMFWLFEPPLLGPLPLMFSLLREVSGESMFEERDDRPCLSVRFLFMRDLLLNRTVANLMPMRVGKRPGF